MDVAAQNSSVEVAVQNLLRSTVSLFPHTEQHGCSSSLTPHTEQTNTEAHNRMELVVNTSQILEHGYFNPEQHSYTNPEQDGTTPEQQDGPTNTGSQSDQQQHSEIETFLSSISTKPTSPILSHRPRQIHEAQENTPTSTRQSIRLAQKAAANASKGTVEIAHDLLVKKLGPLAGGQTNDNQTNIQSISSDGVNLYVQHFTQPLDKVAMGAIQDLIEQGGMIQMQDNQEGAFAAPVLTA